MEIVQRNKETIISVLRTFIADPFIDCKSGGTVLDSDAFGTECGPAAEAVFPFELRR